MSAKRVLFHPCPTCKQLHLAIVEDATGNVLETANLAFGPFLEMIDGMIDDIEAIEEGAADCDAPPLAVEFKH